MSDISDAQHAMLRYSSIFQQYKNKSLTLQNFIDGWIFVTMMKKCGNFKINSQTMIQCCNQKWTARLNNLKKIINAIDDYFQQQIKKGVRIKDIDLIEIAKNKNTEEVLKLFALVVAVMTEAPNKQDHINKIMSLDQRSQSAFVSIIKNNLQTRILSTIPSKQSKLTETLTNLQMQNSLLGNQVDSLLNQNYDLNLQIQQLKQRQNDYQDQLHRLARKQSDKIDFQPKDPKEKQHLKALNQNLKQKLVSIVRQNQIKISGLREQINVMEGKLIKMQQLEQQLQQYRKKYSELISEYELLKQSQKQKNKLTHILQQKQTIIKKLNKKLEEAHQLNYQMEVRELDAKLEMEKKQINYKEMEKQVKKKNVGSYSMCHLEIPNSAKLLGLGESTGPVALSQEISSVSHEEVEEMKNQIEKLKKKNRESQRENSKLKRNFEKNCIIENEKKKLERLVMELNNEKRQHVQLLLATTYEFYNENLKLRSVLAENQITV